MCWAPAWACTCTVWPICQEAEGDIIIFIEIEGAPALQVSSLPELCKLFVTNTSSRCIHSIFIIADRYNRDIYEHWHCSDQVRSKSGWPAGFYWNSPTYSAVHTGNYQLVLTVRMRHIWPTGGSGQSSAVVALWAFILKYWRGGE